MRRLFNGRQEGRQGEGLWKEKKQKKPGSMPGWNQLASVPTFLKRTRAANGIFPARPAFSAATGIRCMHANSVGIMLYRRRQ